MKALLNVLLALLLAASLSACAATSGGEMAKVKCPACGHEFTPKPVGP
jgi:hypothetical protein